MDVADLRLLDSVAELGSFTAAAAAMRWSQPSVSSRIAALERVVGATLFVRDRRGATLTPAGARYLGYVRRSLQLLDEGAHAAASDDAPAEIAVGVPASYAASFAPLLLTALASSGRPLHLRSDHSGQLRAAVLDGRLSAALVTVGPVPAGLRSRPCTSTRVVALSRPDRRDGDRRFALHPWDVAVDGVLADLLARGVPRSSICVVSPAAAAIALAIDEAYIAVVPELCAARELRNGQLVVHDVPLPRSSVQIEWLYHPMRTEGGLIDAMMSHVGAAVRAKR
jgi:DNA-binding transcriptional LysR family regulator